MVLGYLQMNNSENIQDSKQTLNDVLSGEEPTEEFLEDFRIANESDEISESELAQQALAIKPSIDEAIDKPAFESTCKTIVSNIIGALIFAYAMYWLANHYFL